MPVHELNLDGLVGPTHHFAGLSPGNIASTTYARTISNPAQAAHQGIQKMRILHRLGVKQAVLPPHPRPNTLFLDALGLSNIQTNNLTLLSAAFSASSMWTANAATVTPSTDTADGRVHITAANLAAHLHRHQEADFSHKLLKQIFPDTKHFVHHPVLPKTPALNDEGAANHNRFAAEHSASGLHLFVYDRKAAEPSPAHFPARQTREASEAIARSHTIDPRRVLFAAQSPKAIDAGVFHNDVIALANASVFLLHQDAFINQAALLKQLKKLSDFPLQIIEISRDILSLENAVQSYVFNSQLVTLPNSQNMAFIAPNECQNIPCVKALIESLIMQDNPIAEVHYVDLKQSMHNGGGPACLRLRMQLNDAELQSMHPGILVTDALLDTLDAWVTQHYRTELCIDDLRDPKLTEEALIALNELSLILDLPKFYEV